MNTLRGILILSALTVCLPLPAWPSPQAQDRIIELDGDLECNLRLPFDARPRLYSCIPILFEFTNTGEDRMIRVAVEADGDWSSTFSVPGGRISRGFLYLPTPGHLYRNDISFYDAETGAVLKSDTGPRTGGGMGSRDVLILTVSNESPPRVINDFCSKADVRFSQVSPERLPDSWVGLTAVDLLIVPHATWISAGMKIDPVVDWIAMGGVCLIVDAPEEDQWSITRGLEAKGPLVRVKEQAPGRTQAALTVHIGAGEVRFIEARTLQESAYFTDRPSMTRTFSAGKGVTTLPRLQELEGPPFLPVLFFLLVFSVLVGPVGWWYAVGRKGQPLIYFVLAPLLSLCVVVIVIAVDFFNQGIRPKSACIAVELIDQATQRRITLSQFALYFPFSIGQSLEGDFNELPHFLSVQNNAQYGYSLRGLTAAPTREGMVYGGTALPARRTSWYAREKIYPERRRLAIWKESGKIHVENHLGMAIEQLLVCCEGAYARFDRLDDGVKQEAEPVSLETAVKAYRSIRDQNRQKAIYYPLEFELLKQWFTAFQEGRNTYVAQRSDGFESLTWAGNAAMQNSSGLVFGIY